MQTQTLDSQPNSVTPEFFPSSTFFFSSTPSIFSASKRPAYSRHRRKCAIRSHAQCPAIEDAFLRFRSPSVMACDYNVRRRTIYRHARALGLFPRRNRRLAHSLELIMEKADRFEPTADDIITAVDQYRKFDPDTFEKIRTRHPKQIIIEDKAALEAFLQSNPSMRHLVGDVPDIRPPASSFQRPDPRARRSAQAKVANRHTPESTSPAIPSKQTRATQPNRHKYGGCPSRTPQREEGRSPEKNSSANATPPPVSSFSSHSPLVACHSLPIFQIGPVTARFTLSIPLNPGPNATSSTLQDSRGVRTATARVEISSAKRAD